MLKKKKKGGGNRKIGRAVVLWYNRYQEESKHGAGADLLGYLWSSEDEPIGSKDWLKGRCRRGRPAEGSGVCLNRR